jgi:hypothetical protein
VWKLKINDFVKLSKNRSQVKLPNKSIETRIHKNIYHHSSQRNEIKWAPIRMIQLNILTIPSTGENMDQLKASNNVDGKILQTIWKTV